MVVTTGWGEGRAGKYREDGGQREHKHKKHIQTDIRNTFLSHITPHADYS